SLFQMYSSTGASQRRQSTPPSPWRGSSRSTGGRRGRGVISPSNGNESHSSTGGIRRESLTRSKSCSGVSVTGPRCYSRGVARVLLRDEARRELLHVQ